MNKFPKWVYNRVDELTSEEDYDGTEWNTRRAVAFCRYILGHEKPPVSKITIKARELFKAFGADEKMQVEIDAGKWDNSYELDLIKLGLENG